MVPIFTAEISESPTGQPQFWSPTCPGGKCKAGHPQQKGQLAHYSTENRVVPKVNSTHVAL